MLDKIYSAVQKMPPKYQSLIGLVGLIIFIVLISGSCQLAFKGSSWLMTADVDPSGPQPAPGTGQAVVRVNCKRDSGGYYPADGYAIYLITYGSEPNTYKMVTTSLTNKDGVAIFNDLAPDKYMAFSERPPSTIKLNTKYSNFEYVFRDKVSELGHFTVNCEKAAIYSLLLNENPISYTEGTPIIIMRETNLTLFSNPYYDDKYGFSPSIDEETIVDFKTVNEFSQIIDETLSLSKPYELVYSLGEYDLSHAKPYYDWEKLNHKYPDLVGVTTFSSIGFNNELNQALVYMENYINHNGDADVMGGLYFLVRNGSVWKIEDVLEILLW